MEARAPVCRVIPFSYVDGPGNRTAVFFQGCGFRCTYCHNPESVHMCIHCGVCVSGCPAGALRAEGGRVEWDSTRCIGCDRCIMVCPHSSNPRIRMLTAAGLWDECAPQLPFIQGITVSGGECTRQHEFLPALFDLAHKAGKTAFVDTNGETLFSEMPDLTQAMDMAMLDVKSVLEEEHRALTGCSCAAVLENVRYLADLGKLYEIRTVVAPGLRSDETVDLASRLIAPYHGVRYKLIRFRSQGVRGPMAEAERPSAAVMEELAALARANGVREIEIV